MKGRRKFVFILAVGMVLLSQPILAAQLVTTLGAQDFVDGAVMIGIGDFNTAAMGEAAPFDQFYGGDVAGPNFSGNWTFRYIAPATISAAAITFGIFDHDSGALGPQVVFFGFDGNDMTSSLNAAFDSHGGANGEYDLYTLAIPAGALSALQDGSATFTLTLGAPGLGAAGATGGNGAGLDFSTLTINPVPEPATVGLLSLGIGGCLFVMARRRS